MSSLEHPQALRFGHLNFFRIQIIQHFLMIDIRFPFFSIQSAVNNEYYLGDGIQTARLKCWRLPLYQLCHSHWHRTHNLLFNHIPAYKMKELAWFPAWFKPKARCSTILSQPSNTVVSFQSESWWSKKYLALFRSLPPTFNLRFCRNHFGWKEKMTLECVQHETH